MTKKTVWRFLFCLAVSVLLVSVMSACGFGMLGEDDPYDDPYYDENRVCVFYYWNDENNNVSEFYVTEGSSSASFDPPYREGYRFNGLFTDAQGGSMVFDADGRAVVVIDSNMNLYAQWTPLTYSIVFDAKEGTLTTAELERNVTSGSKLIEFPAATREGYTFNGWKNSRGELVTQGNTFVEGADTFNAAMYPTDENGVVRLTADYTIQECLITFDFCDGREPLTQSVFWGSPVTQIEYPQEDTGSAEIVSWSLSSGTQIDYADTTIKTDITFYAIWRDYKVFTYHLGNGADNIVEKVYNGVSYNPPQPQRNGYSFAGWYSSDVLAGFPEQSISYHSYYSEYYAKWTLDTYTVYFEPYGGTGELSPLNYDFEHALALPVVEKEYCTFLGWCRNADLSDAPMTELPAGSYGDVTLYAKYEGRKTFVYLDAGEGKLSDDSFSVEYSAWNYLPVPEYEGFIFRGWYLDDTQMTDGDGKTLDLWNYLENGMTLTARYAQAYMLTVQINNEKGAVVNVRDKYAQGDEVLFDLVIAEGWMLVDLKSDYGYGIKAGETFEMPAKNVTVTITVEPNTYNVTLFAGENAYLKTDSLTVEMNSVVTLPTPAMQGHRFIGWFYGDVQVTDGGGALCSADGWNIASDVTLSAKYENDGNTFVFIQSAEDLIKIRDNPGGKYRLLCDIHVDLWETIDFAGTFDGGGYKISGLRCPLFGTVTGTVENLTLKVNITNAWTGNNRLGGVACYLSDYGMIRNVTVEGSIQYSGTVDVGGIVGFINSTNTTLTGCTNYAEIVVTENNGYSVGGIVGATNACASTFANNKNYGSVTNLNGNTGGIFGYVEWDGVIKNCENHSEKIKGLYSGGIIGNAASGTVAIDSCSSKGTLEGEEVGRYVGRCNSTVVYTNMPAVTVTNAAEFVEAIKYNVASEDIILEADIDLSGINWKPYELYGNLIGNGHTIKNLSITSSDSHVGMFTIVRGTVMDLTLVDFNIVSAGHSGCARIGAICGDVIDGTISNVTVESGSITGAVVDAGGISGYLSSGSISNCVNHVDITAQTTGSYGSVGGIVGYMTGGTLTDCENYGTIQTPYRVGGICGGMVVGGDNYTKNLANYGAVIGTELVGGLYGFYDGGTLTIDSCTVRANIIGSKVTGRYAGKGNVKYLNIPVTTISTLEEFAQIRYHVAEDTFILQNDIVLDDYNWITSSMSATLDGNGHKITGLTAPLFETVTGHISNLEVHYNISMEAPYDKVGGVACRLRESATITNVHTYGSIQIKNNCDLGGIVGFAYDQSVISECTNHANVTITNNNGYSVGGICGAASYVTTSNYNKNYGNVTNATGNAGGIFGYIEYGPASQIGCHNSGNISGVSAGGIVGVQNRGTLTVDGCTVDGFVKGTSRTGKFLSAGGVEYLNVSTVSIKTVDDLLKMSAHAAPEVYILEADLDLTDVKWTTFDFTATLDGNGHKITGLTVPLFMTVTGNISNLEVHYNISMDAPTENVGGVAYTLRGTATIDNVHTYGSIQIKNNCFLGGIVGRAHDKSVITNCSNHANVTILNNNGYYIGGICGVVAPTTTVNSNKNYGDVTNAAGDAGGILGYVENGPYSQTNSYNGGTITGATAGGIIGVQYRGTVTIDNCTVDGIVKGTSNTGKFVGRGGVAYQNLPTVSIKTVDDLKKMAVHVAPEIYVLEADLDLSEVEWTAFDFYATFDGNGHKITGLNKNLFNKVTGTVKNLTLEKVNINTDGQSLVAALALDLRENALIENVTANGTITAANADYVGGIVCYAYGNSIIRGCKSYLNIDATTKNVDYYVGGILGGIANDSVCVENCINYGAVKGNSNVGGIMGYYYGYKPIVGCSNYGTLTSTHRTGGIVGYARRSLIIDGCGSYGEFGEGAVFGKYVCTGTVTYQNLPVQEIDSYEDLLDLKYNIKEETYVLVKDIDMTGKTWTPLELLAKIDGNGHKIIGLTLNAATGDLAMFTKIRGSVENLTLENINVTSTSYEQVLVAGLCAELIDGTLKNVTVTGTLTAQSGYAAAVVAKQTSGTVEGCVNHASVKSKMTDKDGSAAGVIGWYAGGTVRDCKNYGIIEKQHCAGGVIGYMSAADAMGLTNYGEVSGKTETGGVVGYLHLTSGSNINLNFVNEGKVTGADNVGGVFGNFTVVGYNTQTLVVNLLTNKGAVTGENQVGGIFGYFDAYATNYSSSILTATVSQLENTGSVTGKSYVGGIIGRGSTDTGNSKFVGVKSAAAVKGEYYVGGLAGRLDYIVLEDCSNAGSTVTATGYLVDGSNYYTYLGGYVGYGYGITNCINDVSLSYTQKGSYIGGLGGYLTGNILSSQNNASITATKSSCVGGVAGCNVVGGTTMYNVKNYGEVKGGDYTGGLIGKMHVESYNTATLTLTGFENHAAVTGGQYTGGLFGHVNGYATNYSSSVLTLNATGLINTGNVTGKTYVGGFIGYGYTDTSESVISDSKSSCAVEGEYYVGGLAGYLEYIQLSSCSNEGSSVKATGYFVENSVYYTYLGGYAGRGYAMTDCVNDVKISYTLKGGYVGGLAGYALGAYNDCVNNGEVYAPKSDNIGGIAGYSYLGVDALANNENTGAITGNNCVGGIAGKMYGESYSAGTLALHGFKNSGEIKGTQYTGGIVGHAHMYAYQFNSSTLKLLATGFANTGKVTGTTYVGGLFGYAYSDTTESAISDSSSSGAITGESYVGGLAGQLDNIQMNSCSNEGASVTATGYFIEGSNYFTYLGGYVGRGYMISDCENAVNISYTIKGAYIGGIAGYAQNHFNSCVNKGNIYAPNSDYVGGVMGCSYITSGGTAEANSNSGTVTGKNRVGGIVGKLYGDSYAACTLNWNKQNNTGTVKGEQYVGGLAGEVNASAYQFNSSTMTVLASELNNTGSVTGTDFVGGLAGEVYTDSGNSALTGYMSVGAITCEGENTSDMFAKATNFIINN